MSRVPALALLLLLVVAPARAAPAGVESHDVAVRFDPDSRRLELTARITETDRRVIDVAIAPWLALERAVAAGKPLPARQVGGRWQITRPMSADGLTLELSGTVPPLPEPGARRRWSGAVAGPEGSALTAGSGWLPDTGAARVRYRLDVAVPTGYRAVASGRLQSEQLGPSGNRATFVIEQPGEPPSLFVGPYLVSERMIDGRRLRTWFHPELAPLADSYLDASAGYIARFSAAIGAYPYPDFHVVAAPLPVGLGFPGLAYVGRRVLPLPFMRGRSLAHEVLHNWWGNGVGVDYARGNWAEGLTTYMADYALAADEGADRAREMRLGWLRDFAALPPARDLPVRRFVAKRHQAAQVIGYGKTAFVFHMLSQQLGEDAFAQGLRLFWQRHRFATAAWDDLEAAFGAASGQDLEWFFAQWLDRTGAPELVLAAAETTTDGDGHRLDLTLQQAGPAYRLTVPVQVETAAGVRQERVLLNGTEATATFHLAAAPMAVRVDPALHLFRRLSSGESPPILRDVTLATDAVLQLADADVAVETAARALARRLFETPVPTRTAGSAAASDGPALIVGTHAGIAALLATPAWQLDRARPTAGGSAIAWTARRADGRPVLVVAGEDAEALRALQRPLPHYGGKSYVRFSGRRAIDHGVWPPGDSPLTRRFDGR